MTALYLVETEGFDLRFGGGHLAALTCPRHVIHYRSGSNPSQGLSKRNSHPFG